MSVVVTLKGGSEVGLRVEFADDEAILIGSGAAAKLRAADDPMMAGEHAVIERTPGGSYVLRDLGTTQGSYVNDTRVQTSPLRTGDIIRCGLTTVQVSLPDLEEAPHRSRVPTELLGRDAGPAAPAVPSLAGYSTTHELPTGQWSRVYRAIRREDGQPVVIKELHPGISADPTSRLMFHRETAILMSLHHPNIVRFLHGEIEDAGAMLFVMEYVEGQNLRELVSASGGRLALGDARAIACQVLDALDYAHGADRPVGPIVHRDVKPDNILVSRSPGDYRAKLADFGVAKCVEMTYGLTETGDLRGTLAFMPAEQLLDSKHVGPGVDLYAMGCVLYFCLCGHLIYDEAAVRRPSELVNAVARHKVIPIRSRRPDLPAPLADVVDQALASDPAQRFPTARDMKLAIARALPG